MSHQDVIYRNSKKWLEEVSKVRKELVQAKDELYGKEAEWKQERRERQQNIDELKRRIHDNYAKQDNVLRHKEIISKYTSRKADEEHTMEKFEYASRCLEFIKDQMIVDAQSDSRGLKECDVGDELSDMIEKLALFLEGFGTEMSESTESTDLDPVYLPAEALYDGGPGKFVKRGGIAEPNFPSIFGLTREGFSLDGVIGIAHLQFIGGIRDEEDDIIFQEVAERKDWKGRLVDGYWGVSFPPQYFRHSVHHYQQDAPDWRNTITEEEPAKMYIGDYTKYDQINSMDDILEDGRLYDNRFGLKYDSKPENVYWDYSISVDSC